MPASFGFLNRRGQRLPIHRTENNRRVFLGDVLFELLRLCLHVVGTIVNNIFEAVRFRFRLDVIRNDSEETDSSASSPSRQPSRDGLPRRHSRSAFDYPDLPKYRRW